MLGTDAEFYGCRPRVETVWHLNPFELIMYWGARRFDGTHSLESISGPDQLCFPDEPGLADLRKHWYIYRRQRLHIPASPYSLIISNIFTVSLFELLSVLAWVFFNKNYFTVFNNELIKRFHKVKMAFFGICIV